MSVDNLILEVCVDSIESALNAHKGGANRIELCAALSEGGLTPNLGLFCQIRKMIPSDEMQIFVMLRPRRGTDFNYSENEIQSVLLDLQEFKKRGADGFVFGALTNSTQIDTESCLRITQAANPLPVTFHRAFDVLEGDSDDHFKTLIELGFKRLLTSGHCSNAEDGLSNISRWNEKYGQSISIMPGAGINQKNLSRIITESNCKEFHSSCKETLHIPVNKIIGDLERNVLTQVDTVESLVNILKSPSPK